MPASWDNSIPSNFDAGTPAPQGGHALHALFDRSVGWWEKRRQARGAGPSLRAWREASAYYSGLYQDRGPNPAAFRRLLMRCGTPDWANPFPEGDAGHFLFHPLGFLAADLETVLEAVQDVWSKSLPSALPSQGADSTDDWPDLASSQEAGQQARRQTDREWGQLAGLCWALAVVEGTGMPRLRQQVHADNLSLAVWYATEHVPLETLGLTKSGLVTAAIQHGLVSPQSAWVKQALAATEGVSA